MSIPSELIALINQQSSREAPVGVWSLVEMLLKRYENSAQAILFYGSCFRTGDDSDGLVDLYVLVDNYRFASQSRMQIIANKLLPPNVFYLELPVHDRVVRTKYAVLSLADFQRGTSKKWFHPYLWGRFSQPTGLVYARTSEVAELVKAALAQAVFTFLTRVVPQMNGRFTARELWCMGLTLSYRTELRSERQANLVKLFDSAETYYEQLTRAAMASVPYDVKILDGPGGFYYEAHLPLRVRFRNSSAWSLRKLQGKVLSILRLCKAFFTFDNGLEYIQWKIERHSGIETVWTPRLKKHPLLAVCVLCWKLYRKGGFR